MLNLMGECSTFTTIFTHGRRVRSVCLSPWLLTITDNSLLKYWHGVPARHKFFHSGISKQSMVSLLFTVGDYKNGNGNLNVCNVC